MERRDRDDGSHAGRDRHRHRQHVVDQQRRGGQDRRILAEVFSAHDVGTAARGIGEDRLAIRNHHDHQQHGHDYRDWDEFVETESEAGGARRDHEQDLLGGVRRRRNGVGAEDRKADQLADALMIQIGRRDWLAHQQSFQRRGHVGSPYWEAGTGVGPDRNQQDPPQRDLRPHPEFADRPIVV